MLTTNEVLLDIPYPNAAHLDSFPYISEEIFKEPRISEKVEKNNINRILGEIPNHVTVKDNILPSSATSFNINILASLGDQLSMWLVKILEHLQHYDKHATHSIAARFESYQKEEQEIDFSIDLHPSIKFIAEVTRIEEPEPEFYFE